MFDDLAHGGAGRIGHCRLCAGGVAQSVAGGQQRRAIQPDCARHRLASGDWPEDIEHFCAALICGPGMRINTPPLTMEIRRDLNGASQLPHNALADAKANRLAQLGQEETQRVETWKF